jgi:hypothetical protein
MTPLQDALAAALILVEKLERLEQIEKESRMTGALVLGRQLVEALGVYQARERNDFQRKAC